MSVCVQSVEVFQLFHKTRPLSSTSGQHVTRYADTVSVLRSSTCEREIYLVGTAHVSEKSAQEVAELVRRVRPTVVAVELCDERLATMRETIAKERRGEKKGEGGTSEFVRRAVRDFFGAFTGARGPGNVADGLLGAAMKTFYGFFRLSGLEPGKEFKEAVKEAEALGAQVVCADRDVRETLRRLRENLSFDDVMAIVSGRVRPGGPSPPPGIEGGMDDIENVVESLKTRANVRQMREFLEYQFPRVSKVFIEERDDIMFDALMRIRAERVVAVVGMAHMDGIERRWEETQERLRLRGR